MPHYFYHIGIELFDLDRSLPITLSQTFRALNPFTSHRIRISRDHRYDTTVGSMRPQSSSFSHIAASDNTFQSSRNDSRIDEVLIETTDDIVAGIGTKFASADTRAAFTVIEENQSAEKGIVHLYRDVDETPGLYRRQERIPNSDLWNGCAQAKQQAHDRPVSSWKDEDCTTVAILAVPSYMTPRDFLAFVGEETRDAVKHFRMIRTSRLNRYMVLMKFKDGRNARQWQNDWNSKLFNAMEPETCHVVFVKSVEVLHNQELREATTRTDFSSTVSNNRLVNKPIAPPTPSLVELPTCPVCLERMDESTGLITNLCQHVFHCTCLEKWSGYGCPVCRFTDDSFNTGLPRSDHSKKRLNSKGEYDIDDQNLDCYECRSSESLWQCLICGIVGCGRYAGKHAYKHYEESGHTFALDLESQRVWDYDRDCYVHRIIANGSSGNEKLVELPGFRREGQATALEDADRDLDIAKRENLAFEYTQLLTSQLESQRIYFEDQVTKAVDTRTKALKQADRGHKDFELVKDQLSEANKMRDSLQDRLDELGRTSAKAENKLQKAKQDYRYLEKKFEEMKVFSDTISENNKLRDREATSKRNELFTQQTKEIRILREEIATKNFFLESLQEQVNDLRIQVAATKSLQAKVASGELTQEEIEGATLFAGPSTYIDGTPTSAAPTSRSKKRETGRAKSLVAKEPTDEEVQASIVHDQSSPSLGKVAAMVKDRINPAFKYTQTATESKIIANGIETNWLVPAKNDSFKLNDGQSLSKIESMLYAEELIEIATPAELGQASLEDPHKAEQILHSLFEVNHLHVTSGKTVSDIWQTLVEHGIAERKEEDNLYESDTPAADHADEGAKAISKGKSKKKKNKKRRN